MRKLQALNPSSSISELFLHTTWVNNVAKKILIKRRKKCVQLDEKRAQLFRCLHRTPHFSRRLSFSIKPNKHKGLLKPVNTRKWKFASPSKGFPRPKKVTFDPKSWTPYGRWKVHFRPPKSPKNSQKIFLKYFRKNPQKWLRKHFLLKSFRNMSIHQTWISKVQTKPRWIISSTTPTHCQRHLQLTRRRSERASTELLITLLHHKQKLQLALCSTRQYSLQILRAFITFQVAMLLFH